MKLLSMLGGLHIKSSRTVMYALLVSFKFKFLMPDKDVSVFLLFLQSLFITLSAKPISINMKRECVVVYRDRTNGCVIIFSLNFKSALL